MVERLHRGKRIDNGEWVYGFYFCMYHDDDRKHLHHFIIPLNVSIPKDRPIGEIQVEVDPNTVGQCVSDLPDKNGKKIFEGDIVREDDVVRNGKIQIEGQAGRVSFVKCCYIIEFGESWDFLATNAKSVKVIGNIHDNPELLGG
ncbi:MAG: hypothetical protein II698_04935 [Ruminococcus sp.]|nr:hypothetical protein [Ruminococcus sp.]MBQ4238635.1 hypothetical protein [Ruminococcus sp.]